VNGHKKIKMWSIFLIILLLAKIVCDIIIVYKSGFENNISNYWLFSMIMIVYIFAMFIRIVKEMEKDTLHA